jgi:hypothetical protein
MMFTDSRSRTHKFKYPHSEHAVYFTVVRTDDEELLEDRSSSVIGLFVNSKEMSNFQWVSALMTSCIKTLNRGGELSEIIELLCETYDPSGDYIIPKSKGKRVNGVVHHLGLILEKDEQLEVPST